MKYLLSVSLCVFLSSILYGQQTDSLATDTVPVKPPPALTNADFLELPDLSEPRIYRPKQALLWAIVPGGGQVYNRRWWKVPLVYSAFVGMVAAVDYNQSNYTRFQTAYQAELAGEDHEFTGTRLADANQLRVLRNGFDKNRQMSYVGLFIIYALQGVEAFVDSHLRNFDIDDDLSQSNWRIRPSLFIPGPGAAPVPALSLEWRF